MRRISNFCGRYNALFSRSGPNSSSESQSLPLVCLFVCLFVCVQDLRLSQPNEVMSCAVSLPNHTHFTWQAVFGRTSISATETGVKRWSVYVRKISDFRGYSNVLFSWSDPNSPNYSSASQRIHP